MKRKLSCSDEEVLLVAERAREAAGLALLASEASCLSAVAGRPGLWVLCSHDIMELLGHFLTSSDLSFLYECCKILVEYVRPVLVPRLAWHANSFMYCNYKLPYVHYVTEWDFAHHGTLEIFPNLKLLSLSDDFDSPLQASMLPPSLIQLDFGFSFNRPLAVGVLPAGLTQLIFSHFFNQQLAAGVLPEGLKQLSFGATFNQPLVGGLLPAGLTHLSLGHSEFNQPLVAGVLPAGLTHLSFGPRFNQPLGVGVLPAGLTQLNFDVMFNQPLLPGVFPPSLTKLSFGLVDRVCHAHFNQPLVAGVLPGNLKELWFGSCFNQVLQVGVLPPGLEIIGLGRDFGQWLRVMPATLMYIRLPKRYARLDHWLRLTLVPGNGRLTIKYLKRNGHEFGYPCPRWHGTVWNWKGCAHGTVLCPLCLA
jgi:hypothetical protein